MEQSAPADGAGVNEGVAVGEEAGGDVAVPGVAGRVEGHVDEHGSAENIVARDAAPIAGVEGIFAIVAHDEVTVIRNGERQAGERADELQFGGRLAAADGVIFLESFAVDPDATVMDVYRFAGQADDALDVVGLGGIERRLKDDDLLALGFAPQGNVNVGEGDSGIVANAAHDEVIADEQGVFHGAGRNDAGLAEGAVDEHKGENDPKPG